ncbi:uncharacterized protein LOC124361139 [Homalodisca vitripennis]|uniref:uncharacterized protein LOC124361139 n=1 Tax=Homalodisca vitripennis TaxID=197043 RepID=UPI001EEB9C33|nr:uncharacterized protein LOC124361139 [Homalodisca vitripennis]
MLVGGVYLPPNMPSSQYFDFASIVEELLFTSENFEPILLLGDFNLPNADWDPLGSQIHDSASQPIKDLAHIFNLTQVNGVNNDRGILLDLVFSSRIDISVRRSLDRLVQVESHHPALDITVPCFRPVTDNNRTHIYDFRRSDLFEIFRVIQGWPYPELSNVMGDSVETAFIDFCGSLSGVIRDLTPTKVLGKRNFPCWFSLELKALVILKKKLHVKFKKSLKDSDYLEFRSVRARCRTLSASCYRDYILRIENSIPSNVKVFWGHIRNMKRKSSALSNLYLDNVTVDTPKGICDLFASYFSSVYRLPQTLPVPLELETSFHLSGFHISCEEVEETLAGLDERKGAGPDGIPPVVLKFCSGILAPHVTQYFNALLTLGVFPKNLKSSFIAPILKSGDPVNAKNYRPVAI